MGVKKRNTWNFNWSSTTPIPYRQPGNGIASGGSKTGTMAATNVIYTNIQDISYEDNQGLEITWTGTPTGTIEVLCSESGITFYPLTFNPVLTQPTGAAGGYLVNLTQVPWRYIMIRYTNASGSGTISAWIGSKDLN